MTREYLAAFLRAAREHGYRLQGASDREMDAVLERDVNAIVETMDARVAELRRNRERWILDRGVGLATGSVCGADAETADREIARCPYPRR